MWMFLFTLLPLSGIAYVGWHLYVLLPLPAACRWVAVGLLMVSLLLLFPVLGGLLDRLPLPLARVVYGVGTSSLFVLLYLVLVFLALDAGRLVRLVPRSWIFANGVTSVVLVGGLLMLFTAAHLHYLHKVRVPLSLTTTKPLPRDYRIVMATDLHLGYHNGRAELARWVDLINREHPDLILIAGDIIDISVRPLVDEDMAAEFRRLQAPVYACLGNHEYYSGQPRARQFYAEAGIRLLGDQAALTPDSALLIIGRDDRSNPRRKSVAQLAAATSPDGHYTILLDHQPYHLEHAQQAAIDFQLSGHTHRGQVWPISWITDALYECSWGAHSRGATRYYVSSGIGIWGGTFRIGTQSEYVVATLHSTAATLQK